MKILHDIHTHNVLSNCCGDSEATTLRYIEAERNLGMRTFGLSNHIWDESVPGASGWYSSQTIRKALESKSVMHLADKGNLRCLFGTETEYNGCQDRLGMSVEGAKNFDYVLVPNSHLHMRNEVMWDYPEIIELRREIGRRIGEACPELEVEWIDRMTNTLRERHLIKLIPELKTDICEFVVKANVGNFYGLVENKNFIEICNTVPTAIAHPFVFGCFSGELKRECMPMLKDEMLRDCFSRAKRIGAYIEINISAIREVEPDIYKNDMMRHFAIAKEVGCQFTFGTDSHAVAQLEMIRYADEVSNYLGLTKNDIAEFVRDSVEEE